MIAGAPPTRQPSKPPFDAEAAFRLGFDHQRQGRLDEAEAVYRRIIAAEPAHAGAIHYLGLVRFKKGVRDEALSWVDRSIELQPERAEFHANRGNVLRRLGRAAEAVAAFRRAIEIKPDSAEACSDLGAVLLRLGRIDEAVDAFRRAVEANPDSAEVNSDLGAALKLLGDFAEAEMAYRRALAIEPDLAGARYNLGIALLGQGKLAEGWAEYEWRRGVKSIAATQRHASRPLWPGTPVERGALLLWDEQGIGDTILYAGMIPELLARVPRCVLECDPHLRPLFARSFGAATVIAATNPADPRTQAPEIVFQSPLGSLPRWFRDSVAAMPATSAYLIADPPRVAGLRARYRALGPGPIVGISWRSKNPVVGQAKSTPLEAWAPILATPGVSFVDLQYGDTAAERAAMGERLGITIHRDPDIDPLVDLDGFAAQVAAMDLVISVSNTAVHVAGALGRPAWTLLPEGPGLLWYWFRERDDSPWYPSLRLFRQPAPGDWAPVIERVAGELASRAYTEATIAS